jgi:hypothetical protein
LATGVFTSRACRSVRSGCAPRLLVRLTCHARRPGRVFAALQDVREGGGLEEGESQGLPVGSRHLGAPILESNKTRSVIVAVFMVAALENELSTEPQADGDGRRRREAGEVGAPPVGMRFSTAGRDSWRRVSHVHVKGASRRGAVRPSDPTGRGPASGAYQPPAPHGAGRGLPPRRRVIMRTLPFTAAALAALCLASHRPLASQGLA